MPMERMYPPRYWRMRAEEFRTKADNSEREAKESLRQAAKADDILAGRAEKIRTVQDAAE